MDIILTTAKYDPTPTETDADTEIETETSMISYLAQFARVVVRRYAMVYHVEMDGTSVATAKRSSLVALKRAVRRVKRRGLMEVMFTSSGRRQNADLIFAGQREDPLTWTNNTRRGLARLEFLKQFGTVEYTLLEDWCQIYLDKKLLAEGRGPVSALRRAVAVIQKEYGLDEDGIVGDEASDDGPRPGDVDGRTET